MTIHRGIGAVVGALALFAALTMPVMSWGALFLMERAGQTANLR